MAIDNRFVVKNGLITPNVQFQGGTGDQGTQSWNPAKEVVETILGGGVTLQNGEELYYTKDTYNNTGSAIQDGTPVMVANRIDDVTYITPAIADNSIAPILYLGLATEHIASGTFGRVTFFGAINDINTVSLSESGITIAQKDLLYVSATEPGKFTNIPPNSPNGRIFVGMCLKAGTSGKIFVRHSYFQNALETSYDNTDSSLLASNVKTAIDELQFRKADISALSSNIVLYSTISASTISPYSRLVSLRTDPAYDQIAVTVSTGPITTQEQICGQLISEQGVFVGNPGQVNITTIGNIAKLSGNNNQYANFFFRVFRYSSLGTLTTISTSNTTGNINPSQLNSWNEFNATALLDDGVWENTDRIVIRYYANDSGNTPGAEYGFQFGGSTPVRTNIPVPVSVIPTATAAGILVNTSTFSAILSEADDTVQHALNTIDQHEHSSVSTDFTATGIITATGFKSSQVTITASAATTNIDFSLADNFYVIMKASSTFTVSNLAGKIGSTGNIIIKEDAIGGWSFTKATEMKTPLGGASIVQVTDANSLSVISYYVVDASTMLINYIGNFA